MLTHRDSMLCKVYQTTNETIVILKDATKQLSLRLSTVPMYKEAPKIGCNLFRRETLTHHGYEKESTDCIPRSLLVCCHVRLCHGTYPSYENGEESHDPVSHTSNSTITTCTDGTTEWTEDERLGVNIWCCSVSAFCQTGDNNGKSWNFPIISPAERNSTGWTGQPRTLWPRGVARKRRRGR